MAIRKALHPIAFNGPVIILPAEDYRTLLAEAGYRTTPRLARQIASARARFRKGRTIAWELVRRDLS